VVAGAGGYQKEENVIVATAEGYTEGYQTDQHAAEQLITSGSRPSQWRGVEAEPPAEPEVNEEPEPVAVPLDAKDLPLYGQAW